MFKKVAFFVTVVWILHEAFSQNEPHCECVALKVMDDMQNGLTCRTHRL